MLATVAAGLIAVSPAAAKQHVREPASVSAAGPSGSGWRAVTINAFFNDDGPTMWKPDCVAKVESGGRFPHAKDLAGITGAELNDQLSCVKFTYQGAIYYVREPAVDHSGAAHATIKACDKEIAAAQQTGATEGATMGMSGSTKCPK